MSMSEDKDMVVKPEHYNQNGLQAIDVMLAFNGKESVKEHCANTALKYLLRRTHKFNSSEDVHKCIWYLLKYLQIDCGNEDVTTFVQGFLQSQIH